MISERDSAGPGAGDAAAAEEILTVDVEKLAERVWQLMRADARLDTARAGYLRGGTERRGQGPRRREARR